VIGNDGTPAGGISLTASPLGVPLATRLPTTRTDQSGNYRFERLAWWGRYTVYADDSDAGYSTFSTGTSGQANPPEVILSPEHPEATLDLRLPPKAGFVRIHLTNKQTGAAILALQVTVMSSQTPPHLMFSASCSSDSEVLIPSDKDLLLHVTSVGFHEWDESAGKGKHIRVAPGIHVELYVQLAPGVGRTKGPAEIAKRRELALFGIAVFRPELDLQLKNTTSITL
jgi:flavin reductase (DIM6/NTAB) family NADH-FMN oxidoreductase RutF